MPSESLTLEQWCPRQVVLHFVCKSFPIVVVPHTRNFSPGGGRLLKRGGGVAARPCGRDPLMDSMHLRARRTPRRQPFILPEHFRADRYRVNFEVRTLKPFPHLAFPHSADPKTARKWPSFDGELMASSPDLLCPRQAGPDCWCDLAVLSSSGGGDIMRWHCLLFSVTAESKIVRTTTDS
jgi:hypothetical protein